MSSACDGTQRPGPAGSLGSGVCPLLSLLPRSSAPGSWRATTTVRALALAADGTVDWSVGDVESQILPRSCNKPVQALGMVRAGLGLEGELLALACASHSGEPFHLEGVRRILAGAGLDESALQTPPDYPLEDVARDELIRAGGHRSSLAMNCSGKHAAMLATCVVNGWDTATYLDPEHPLQREIATTFAELTGEPVKTTAVDGCGAPLLSTSLVGLARAFGRLAAATEGPERRVADAIRAHPEHVSGTRRDEATLLRAVPGCDRQGGRGVVLRGRAAGRPGVRAQDRRRRGAGPADRDGRRARARRGHRRGRRGRRRRAQDRRARAARRRPPGGQHPGAGLTQPASGASSQPASGPSSRYDGTARHHCRARSQTSACAVPGGGSRVSSAARWPDMHSA